MVRLEILNVNTNKLHDELILAGVIPQTVEHKDNITWITVEENQVDAVNAVVAVHEPTPLPPVSTETEMLRDYVLDLDYRLILMELGI